MLTRGRWYLSCSGRSPTSGTPARLRPQSCQRRATPLVCVERFDRESNEWGHSRMAHGLFTALDLAQDRARGSEILANWQPENCTRVW
jgi:hypothetical protein